MSPERKSRTNNRSSLDFAQSERMFRLLGDRWNILIIREIFFGTNRFGELQRALSIAPNMLTNRLNCLVDEGLLKRHQYRSDKPWYEYRLTRRGEKMLPAWVMMVRLADAKFGATAGDRRDIIHTECGCVTNPVLCCSECGSTIAPGTLAGRDSSGEEQL